MLALLARLHAEDSGSDGTEIRQLIDEELQLLASVCDTHSLVATAHGDTIKDNGSGSTAVSYHRKVVAALQQVLPEEQLPHAPAVTTSAS